MKQKSSQMILRLAFVVIIILAFFIIKYYHCFILQFTETPELILKQKGIHAVHILYGKGLCGSCPPGSKLKRLHGKDDILFIVPSNFSNADIFNLKDAFSLEGEVITGDNAIEEFLKKIASCQNTSDWRINVTVELEEDGNISKIRKF